MEQYTWVLILAGWSVLLLLGLAGGDPLAAGQPGREAPAIAFAKWLHGVWTSGQQAVRNAAGRTAALPRAAVPSRRTTESGLHAAV